MSTFVLDCKNFALIFLQMNIIEIFSAATAFWLVEAFAKFVLQNQFSMERTLLRWLY